MRMNTNVSIHYRYAIIRSWSIEKSSRWRLFSSQKNIIPLQKKRAQPDDGIKTLAAGANGIQPEELLFIWGVLEYIYNYYKHKLYTVSYSTFK